MTIRRLMEEKAEREVSIGAVYATLERLEKKGLISSGMGAPTAARGGRAKRFVSVTPLGRTALSRSLGALHRLQEGLRLT